MLLCSVRSPGSGWAGWRTSLGSTPLFCIKGGERGGNVAGGLSLHQDTGPLGGAWPDFASRGGWGSCGEVLFEAVGAVVGQTGFGECEKGGFLRLPGRVNCTIRRFLEASSLEEDHSFLEVTYGSSSRWRQVQWLWDVRGGLSGRGVEP